MKQVKMLLVAVITVLSVAVFAQDKKTSATMQTEKAKYSCPMHADVTSDKAGKCSKCGMALKATEKAAAAYSCPMHADVTSDKAGKCSKCGMALKATEKASVAYACPMHADVTSDKPGKCTKCGMALTKKG